VNGVNLVIVRLLNSSTSINAEQGDAQCPDMKFAAAQSKDGTLQGYYQLPADLCYKLPDVCVRPTIC